MASVTIGGVAYEIAAPYTLGDLEAAAPFIDSFNERVSDSDTSMVGYAKTLREMLGAMLPGIQRLTPEVTLDGLVAAFQLPEREGVQDAFPIFLRESGLAPGEVKPAEAPAPEASESD